MSQFKILFRPRHDAWSSALPFCSALEVPCWCKCPICALLKAEEMHDFYWCVNAISKSSESLSYVCSNAHYIKYHYKIGQKDDSWLWQLSARLRVVNSSCQHLIHEFVRQGQSFFQLNEASALRTCSTKHHLIDFLISSLFTNSTKHYSP